MPKNTHDLPEIFSAAIAIQDEKERSKLIVRLSIGRPEVREQVHELLVAHQSAKGFLSTPPQEFDPPRTPFHQQESAKNASVMKSLKSELSLAPVILRNETPEETEPMIRPSSPEIPNRNPGDKYQVQGEIARGGIVVTLQRSLNKRATKAMWKSQNCAAVRKYS